MKMKWALLVLILLGLVQSGMSQDAPPQDKPAQQPPKVDFAKLRQSSLMRQSMKTGMKTALRSFWDGKGSNLMAVQLLSGPEIRKGWGVSDEQFAQIGNMQKNMGVEMQKNPEFQKILKELQKFQDPSDPFLDKADEETKKKFFAVQEKLMSLGINSMADTVDGTLTPDQKKKMKEFQLSGMSEIPIVAPSMFEALDLSDAQKQKMEGIKKELEPAFEKNTEEFADAQQILMDKMFAALEKEGISLGDQKAMQEKGQAIVKRLMEEDPEFKKIQEELMAKGKNFSTQFKMKMLDVLTDEQLARLQNLVDNPPEYVKRALDKMKEQMGQKKSAQWQPGADSWKPGEAIPEEYKQKRKSGGFPRKEE